MSSHTSKPNDRGMQVSEPKIAGGYRSLNNFNSGQALSLPDRYDAKSCPLKQALTSALLWTPSAKFLPVHVVACLDRGTLLSFPH